MLSLGSVISFIGAAIVLTLLPGPDNLYVITESIINGKKKGVAIAIGLSLGVIIHTIAAALGVSIVLQQSPLAFSIVQWLGAGYILYLAWMTWRDDGAPPSVDVVTNVNIPKAITTGFFMNVLNPKVALFFLALLPQFIDPTGGSYIAQMLLLGGIFMIQAMVIMSGFALIASSLRPYIKSPAFWKRTRLLKIIVLVGFAGMILIA